jgi:hypothetical protein
LIASDYLGFDSSKSSIKSKGYLVPEVVPELVTVVFRAQVRLVSQE